MKKKWIVVLAAVLLAGVGLWYGWNAYWAGHLRINGDSYSLDTKTLDLSGTENPEVDSICRLVSLESLDLRNTGLTVTDYARLRAALPECEIFWQVPFQGQYLEPDTENLRITSLSEEDLKALAYLEHLKTVDATACQELDMLFQLRQMHPNCRIDYLVALGEEKIPWDVKNLTVGNVDVAELAEKLQYLPMLQQLTLGVTDGENDQILQLVETYPQIRFQWYVGLCGRYFLNTVRELDLSGTQVDSVAEVENALRYFPNLERVVMCNCGVPSEEMDALWKRNPEYRFVWAVPIQNFTVRTDVTVFMPYQYGCKKMENYDAKELKYLVDVMCLDLGHMRITDLSFLPYMPNLEYLIIADCKISDISYVAGLQKLKYLEIFLNYISDISPLAECPALRDLNMCCNRIRDLSPLLELENLEHLWIMGNPIKYYTLEPLVEKNPDMEVYQFALTLPASSTAGGWRKIPGYYEQRDLLGMWYIDED